MSAEDCRLQRYKDVKIQRLKIAKDTKTQRYKDAKDTKKDYQRYKRCTQELVKDNSQCKITEKRYKD
jgi:hypothetical protein